MLGPEACHRNSRTVHQPLVVGGLPPAGSRVTSVCPSPRAACLALLRALGGRPGSRASPRRLPVPPPSSPLSVGRSCPSGRQSVPGPLPTAPQLSACPTEGSARGPHGLARGSWTQSPLRPWTCPPAATCPHTSLHPRPGAWPPSSGGALVSVPPLGRGLLRPPTPRPPPPHEDGPAPVVLALREVPPGEAPLWWLLGGQDTSLNPLGGRWPRGRSHLPSPCHSRRPCSSCGAAEVPAASVRVTVASAQRGRCRAPSCPCAIAAPGGGRAVWSGASPLSPLPHCSLLPFPKIFGTSAFKSPGRAR